MVQERHEKERAKSDKRRQEGLQAVEEAARMAEQAQTERDEAQQALHDLSAQVKAFTGRLLHWQTAAPQAVQDAPCRGQCSQSSHALRCMRRLHRHFEAIGSICCASCAC